MLNIAIPPRDLLKNAQKRIFGKLLFLLKIFHKKSMRTMEQIERIMLSSLIKIYFSHRLPSSYLGYQSWENGDSVRN